MKENINNLEVEEKPLTPLQIGYKKLIAKFRTQLTQDEITLLPPYESHGREVILVKEHNFREALEEIKQEKYLGFDMEAKPTFRKGQKEHKTSLIQVATTKRCFLFFVKAINDIRQIRSIMETSKIVKLGIGLDSDKKRLKSEYKIHSNSLVDISQIFKLLGRENSIGSKQLVALTMNQHLAKSKQQSRSNWASDPLTPAQIAYASDDAFSSVDAFLEMQKIFRPFKKLLDVELVKLLRL